MALYPNKFPGVCNNPACKVHVPAEAGFRQQINGRWVVWCGECVPEKKAAPAQAPAQRRVLTADGKIIMQFEAANYPLIKALPGARWDNTNKWWSVSLEMSERRRILEIADRIGLDVAPSLREIVVTEQAANANTAGLYPFQVEGVNFLAHKTRALLGDEMGLGKTVQGLMAAPNSDGILVICRAGLKYNWVDETKKWRPDLTPVVLNGKGSFRWPSKGEVVIINHDILPVDFHTPARNKGEKMQDYWDRLKKWRDGLKATHTQAANTTLIIDEAHDFKTYDSQRSRKVKEIGKLVKKLIALTGSPLTNNPEDLYGVFEVLGLAKEVFGNWSPQGGFKSWQIPTNKKYPDAFDRFKMLFNAQPGYRGRGVVYGKPDPIVPELLRRVMLRRKRAEVLPDLPSKTYTNLLVGKVDATLQKQLDALWDKWGGFIEVESQLPPFEEFSEIREKLARSRVAAMLEYVENAEAQEVPLVVFSAHLAPIDALLGRPGWAVITGDTKPEKRQEIVRAFQAGHLKGVGITIAAGGVGLTLTHAYKALFVDLAWTPGANWQAEDRIARIGQLANKVEIIRMVSDHPLDLHVHNLLADKIDTIQKSIDDMFVGEKKEIVKVNGESDEEFEARMQRVLAQQAAKADEQRVLDEAARKTAAKGKVDGIHTREKARLKREVLPLTPARVDAVRNSFKYMLSVCDGAMSLDGQGFNKPDAAVAHWLLSAGLETDKEVEAAYYMLTRYHRQLEKSYPILFKEAA